MYNQLIFIIYLALFRMMVVHVVVHAVKPPLLLERFKNFQ